jgi:hypothetical protein
MMRLLKATTPVAFTEPLPHESSRAVAVLLKKILRTPPFPLWL